MSETRRDAYPQAAHRQPRPGLAADVARSPCPGRQHRLEPGRRQRDGDIMPEVDAYGTAVTVGPVQPPLPRTSPGGERAAGAGTARRLADQRWRRYGPLSDLRHRPDTSMSTRLGVGDGLFGVHDPEHGLCTLTVPGQPRTTSAGEPGAEPPAPHVFMAGAGALK